MIRIELSDPKYSICECCKRATTSLTRFVYEDEAAHAIYYAAFSEGHAENGVIGVVSLGEWGTEGVPDSRVAFGFELWLDQDNFKVGIIDAARTPWANAQIIGRKLPREEALVHPWRDDVFQITDHMTVDDPEIKGFFSGGTIH